MGGHPLAQLRLFVRRHGFAWALILPTLLYLLAFQIYPLLQSVYLSLTDLSLTRAGTGKFVGLANYYYLLKSDPQFWLIFRNTFIWVVACAVGQYLFAVPAALILNTKLRARGLWRGLIMVPWVTPVVVVGIMWRWILDGDSGLLNYYLNVLGLIEKPIIWLGSDFWVWPAVISASIWKGFPYQTIMLLAGLAGIPKEVHEAAQVDGATPVQRFFLITLPLLAPVSVVLLSITVVTTWTKFDLIWLLTEGGPGFTTSILPTYVYSNAFVFYKLGLASAVATLSALVVMVLAIVYMRWVNTDVE